MKNSIISLISCSDDIDKYKKIAQFRDKDKDIITSAHKIVKQFLIDRKLIVFGGMAIDYALRLKGDSIYDDDVLPDYDCLSSRNVDDAYDLGEILHGNGFENVKVIRAKHVETMRVRINLITVADIGYIPQKYIDNYKYLIYDQLHILHPDIQRLDLHKSFCFPLNNAPMEDIFHRWDKDLKRFNLYEKYYPILINNPNIKYTTRTYTLPNINYAFHGFVAFSLYRNELLKHTDVDNIPDLHVQIIKKKCTIDIPVSDNNIHLVTDELLTLPYFNPLLTLPMSKIIDNICIYNVNLLSIITIDNMQIVTIQYLLLWLLFNYQFNNNEKDRNIYSLFYKYTLDMISISNTLQLKNNPFYPTLTFIGTKPIYTPFVNNSLLPVNYTPSKIGTRQQFDYSNFKISGELVST